MSGACLSKIILLLNGVLNILRLSMIVSPVQSYFFQKKKIKLILSSSVPEEVESHVVSISVYVWVSLSS